MISHGQSCGSAACPLDSRLNHCLNVFFSVGSGHCAGLPLPGRLSTVPVSRGFSTAINTALCPVFFSGNLSVNLFAVYPFKCKLFLSKSRPCRWIPCWLLTSTVVTSQCCDEFLVPQINRKRKWLKEQWHGKFYLQSVWENNKIFGWISKLEKKNEIWLRFLPHLQKIWIFNSPR